MYKKLIVSFLLFLMPSMALAWGWEGHKLVCALAETRFTPAAEKMVTDLLNDGEALSGGVVSFPEACLWPDEVKHTSRRGTYEHHFINVPNDVEAIDISRDCPAANCLAAGLQQALAYLVRTPSGKREIARRAAALRFLGHYVGDLHQPLHVGRADDWGGNRIEVRWFGKKTNLHALWDYGMMDRMGLVHPDGVNLLASVPAPADGTPVLTWLNESLQLANSRAYVDVQGRPVRSGDKLGQDYLNHNKPIVIERLALAGNRLADIINSIAAGERPIAFTLKANLTSPVR